MFRTDQWSVTEYRGQSRMSMNQEADDWHAVMFGWVAKAAGVAVAVAYLGGTQGDRCACWCGVFLAVPLWGLA